MQKLLWSFFDAGMKLVYLIFCDDMVLNDKKTKKKQKQKQNKTKQKKKTKKKKEKTKNKNKQTNLQCHVYDREVLIKAKHGC